MVSALEAFQFLIIPLEFVLTGFLYWKLKAPSPTFFGCLYTVLAQVIYINGDDFFYTDQRWFTYQYLKNPVPTLTVYSVLFFFLYTTVVGLKSQRSSSLYVSMSTAVTALLKWQSVAGLIVAPVVVVHLTLIDHVALWRNSTYLYLRSSEALGIGAAAGTLVQSLLQVCALVATLYAAAAASKKRLISSALWSTTAIWLFLFYLSDASRTAFILAGLYFVTLFFLSRGWTKILWVALAILAGSLALRASLEARGNGQFGLSSLPSIVAGALYSANKATFIIGNVFEGVFITSESLSADARFSTIYKVLSFSPLPSVIDGFDSIRDREQVRLGAYVPMSGIAETIKFGWQYITLFAVALWFAFRTSIKKAEVLGPFYILVMFGLLSSFIAAGAYPVRNVFKQLLLWTVLTVVVTAIRGRAGRNMKYNERTSR